MQYGEFAFSKNNLPTIESKNKESLTNPYDKIGSAILTPSDISAIKKQYQCSGSVTVLSTTTQTTPTNTVSINLFSTTKVSVVTPSKNQVFSSYTFALINDVNIKVMVFWIDQQRQREMPWFTLNPRTTQRQMAFQGNMWRVSGPGYNRVFTIGFGKFSEQNTNINISALNK
jgi:hypothetical protein